MTPMRVAEEKEQDAVRGQAGGGCPRLPDFPAGEGPSLAVLSSAEASAWRALVAEAEVSDAGHLPDLWLHAEARGEGTAALFVCREGIDFVALPLLLRRIGTVPGLEACEGMDAVSVGDYAGPFASRPGLPACLIRHFQRELAAELRGRGVIFVFSKLNPILGQEPLLDGLGSTEYAQTTVSIDLTLSQVEQFRSYRPRLRNYLRNAWRDSLEPCYLDYDEHLPECLEIYAETMDRVGAAPVFRYPDSYYASLRRALGDRFHLFGVRHDGRLVAAYLCTEWNAVLQGIISCVRTSALSLSPARVMYDFMRRWGSDRGCRIFHLGGGTSPAMDNPLFQFKAGFSGRRHEFRTWRWVVDPGTYDDVCLRKSQWNLRRGLVNVRSDFFPEYRCATREAE